METVLGVSLHWTLRVHSSFVDSGQLYAVSILTYKASSIFQFSVRVDLAFALFVNQLSTTSIHSSNFGQNIRIVISSGILSFYIYKYYAY